MSITASVGDIIEERVRDEVRRSGVDPIRDRRAVRRIVDEEVSAHLAELADLESETPEDLEGLARQIHDRVAGFGPLQPFFDDPEVEEIYVDEPLGVVGEVRIEHEMSAGLRDRHWCDCLRD